VSLFSFTDNVAPTVASIKAEGNEAVVTFAEAVVSAGTVSLDGSVITTTVSPTAPYYEVSGKTLTVKNLVNEQSYKLDIVGSTDAANNISGQITSNFTVAKPVVDDSKPTVSSSVSGNKLTLSFSKKVTAGTVTLGGTSIAAATSVSEDEKTYTYDIQKETALLDGKTFITNEVLVKGFKDTASPVNEMNEVKFNATFTADRTAPKFVAASIKTAANGTDDLILLTFDDAVYAGDLTGSNELVIKSIDGIYQTSAALDLDGSNVQYGYDLDGKDGIKGNEKNVVAISYNTVEKSSYSFELTGKVIKDFYGNPITSTVNFSAVAPEFVAAPGDDLKNVVVTSLSADVNNKDITVLFNNMMSNSALTASNYTLGAKALPAGTTLKFVDNKSKVVISLPEGSITANGVYAFAATNLKDIDGNTLSGGKASSTITLNENVVPVATKVSVTSSKTFTVDFSEAIDAGTATNETVIVKINGTTVSPQSMNVMDGDLVVTTANNFAMTDSISVEFKASDLADANGNKVKNGVVSK